MATRAWPLRLKLTVWFLAVFLVIQLVLLTAIVLARQDSIQRSRDLQLQRSANDMVENILAGGQELKLSDEELDALKPSDAGFRFWVLRDTGGKPFASWHLVQDIGLFTLNEATGDQAAVPTFLRLNSQGAEAATGEATPLRVVSIPFLREKKQLFLQAGVRDRTVDNLLGPYSDLFFVGVPVGLLAALVAAWIIAGRAVSPMRELAEAARAVSPTSLSERIRISAPDQEVRRLEDDLNSALERLEQGYRAQEEFIANVSHELKTPIAVLLTEAQVAQIGPQGSEHVQGFVAKVEREMQRLGRLVESFLTLARAELTKTRSEETNSANDVVLEAVRITGPWAEKRSVRLVAQLAEAEEESREPIVRGDADLLRTMVENLLTNAIRHSPEEQTIDVGVEVVGEQVRICVRDRGPGIPPEYVDKIFDRFVQAPSRAGRKDGTGLGLAIASHVARLHGGAIRARNHADGGCSFVVELPLARTLPRVARAGEAPLAQRGPASAGGSPGAGSGRTNGKT